MKRIYACILAAFILAAILCGCAVTATRTSPGMNNPIVSPWVSPRVGVSPRAGVSPGIISPYGYNNAPGYDNVGPGF